MKNFDYISSSLLLLLLSRYLSPAPGSTRGGKVTDGTKRECVSAFHCLDIIIILNLTCRTHKTYLRHHPRFRVPLDSIAKCPPWERRPIRVKWVIRSSMLEQWPWYPLVSCNHRVEPIHRVAYCDVELPREQMPEWWKCWPRRGK